MTCGDIARTTSWNPITGGETLVIFYPLLTHHYSRGGYVGEWTSKLPFFSLGPPHPRLILVDGGKGSEMEAVICLHVRQTLHCS